MRLKTPGQRVSRQQSDRRIQKCGEPATNDLECLRQRDLGGDLNRQRPNRLHFIWGNRVPACHRGRTRVKWHGRGRQSTAYATHGFVTSVFSPLLSFRKQRPRQLWATGRLNLSNPEVPAGAEFLRVCWPLSNEAHSKMACFCSIPE
jgi:hypothetical protein